MARKLQSDDPDYLFTLRVRLSGGMATITAWDGRHQDPNTGHSRIEARLVWRPSAANPLEGQPREIFPRGAPWCAVNRWTSIDGPEAKSLVMSLFAMKPGDTDRDYFDGYTPDQLSWADAYGEELSLERLHRFGETPL